MHRLREALQRSLRYKLLALVLFPIVLLMPVALVLAVWWGARFTYEQLYYKVNTDLSVAHDAFARARHDYLSRLERLAESYRFRTTLEAGNLQALAGQVEQVQREAGFSYLWLTDTAGHPLQGEGVGRTPGSPLRAAALERQPAVGLQIFSEEELRAISPRLAESVRLPLLPTPRARPTDRTEENRGMMIRAI